MKSIEQYLHGPYRFFRLTVAMLTLTTARPFQFVNNAERSRTLNPKRVSDTLIYRGSELSPSMTWHLMAIGSKAVQRVLRFPVHDLGQQFLTMHGLGFRAAVVLSSLMLLVLLVVPSWSCQSTPPPLTTATAAIATMPATTQASSVATITPPPVPQIGR